MNMQRSHLTQRRTLMAMLCWLCTAVVVAQQPVVNNYRPTDYSSGKQNWWIDMTETGVMLFANCQGLLTFDSEEWCTYPLNNFSDVRAVHYNKVQDRIYAGGTNEIGYYCHDPRVGSLKYNTLTDQLATDARDFGEIWAIFQCENGNYVFSAKHKVLVMKPGGEFVTFSVPHAINCSALTPYGTILACRERIYTIRNMKLQPLAGSEALAGKTVRAITPLDDGRVLFATDCEGLWIYDGEHAEPWTLDISDWLASNIIFCVARQGETIAFGTVRGGLAVRNLKDGTTLYANAGTGLQNNTVLSMRFDRQGNLWLGLDQGLAYVQVQSPYRELLSQNSTCGTGYTTLVDGGRILLGTNQGLYTLPWPVPSSAEPPVPVLMSGLSGQIWSLRNIGGDILCGGDHGAWHIQGTAVRSIDGLEGTWDFKPIPGEPQLAIASDYSGLAVLEKTAGQWHLRNRIVGFEGSSGSFELGRDGCVWISMWQKGIYRLWLDEERTKVVKCQVYNADNGLPTDDNNLLSKVDDDIVVTAADGFHRYLPLSGKLERDTILNGLFGVHELRLRLIEDPRGNVWAFNSERVSIGLQQDDGTLVVDTASFRPLAPRLQHGLGHFGFTPDGRIVLNTENGFIVADNHRGVLPPPARLFIRRVTATADSDTVVYEAPTRFDENADGKAAQAVLTLAKELNTLRIEFVMPEFVAPSAVQYACWLEGYDQTWRTTGANFKEYTRLPKGSYTLHVRCLDSTTGQTDVCTMQIEIRPAWYETWWATALYAVLSLMLLYGSAMLLYRRYRLKLQATARKRERDLREQQTRFDMEQQRKEKELVQLKNEQLELELKHKGSQLADSTVNLIRKNDMLQLLDEHMSELSESIRREDPKAKQMKVIREIRQEIATNIEDDSQWNRFEENFNLVYDNFLQKLTDRYPVLKLSDRKLCAYLRMGLSSKEMASLLNTSVRSIETARYRLRRKLELDQGRNLQDFLQSLD